MSTVSIDELHSLDPVEPQPAGTLVMLKHHQLTLLHRCKMYEKIAIDIHACFPSLRKLTTRGDTFRTRVGIIGDRAGSGKSFVVLSLICSGSAGENMPVIRTYGMNTVHHVIVSDERVNVHTNLLVIPHNLVVQWEKYVEIFCPSVRILVVKSTRMLAQLARVDPVDYDIIIATSTYYNNVIQIANSKNIKFNRAIFDEVDNMNIPGCVKPDAAFMWFVTASYNNLLSPRGRGSWNSRLNKHIWSATGIRSMGFVKTLFLDMAYSMTPPLMKMLVIKNSDAFVVTSMSLAPVSHTIVPCRTPNTINLLHGLVDKMIINYLNAGDVASAMQFINSANKDTEENIVIALIDKYTRALDVLDARALNEEEEDIEKKHADLRNKITSIRDRIVTTNTCCICYENIENKSIAPCCSNSYCLKCITTWLSQKLQCPMCKADVQIADLMVVNSALPQPPQQDAIEETSEKNSKAKNLEIIINRRKPGDKILIFSLYDRALLNVGNVLEANDVRYCYLKGNQHQISSTLKQYNESTIDVMLINPTNYGCGINMEKTTDIIMLHKFDTDIEGQVIGRANRIGRQEELRVWYLLYDNERP